MWTAFTPQIRKRIPPLRSLSDQKALWAGIGNGTIDAICSNHQPQNLENKAVEFDYAKPGMAIIETMVSMLLQAKPAKLPIETLFSCLNHGPRRVLNLPQQSITKGSFASFTIVDPKKALTVKNLESKSVNSPAIGKKYDARVVAVLHKGVLHKFN